MIAEVAAKLDAWVVAKNLAAWEEGLRPLPPCHIRVLGQTALLEGNAPFHLNVTNDVDVHADYENVIQMEFQRLLAAEGKQLDPVGHEAWMPSEATYSDLFVGEYVVVQLADVDSVLLSKALHAPRKNHALIVEYLAAGPTERFMEMTKRYGLDLEQFL